MTTPEPWYPRFMTRELQRLFDRQVPDFGDLALVYARRAHRAVAPSPDQCKTQDGNSALLFLPDLPPSRTEARSTPEQKRSPERRATCRAINQVHGSGDNPAGEHESEEQDDGAETEETDDRAEMNGSDSLADRDWEILGIDGRKVQHDVVYYHVCWKYTVHPTSVVHQRTPGDLFADVDGKPWPIIHRSETRSNKDTGERQSIVEWRGTWYPIWRLYRAYELVVNYEKSRQADEADRRQPVLVHRPMQLDGMLDPETEVAEEQGGFDDEYLEVRPGVDYTMSFLDHQLRMVRRGSTRMPGIPRFLNHPLRQALIFPADSGLSHYRTGGRGQLLRALFVYIVGEAWEQTCDSCQQGGCAFTKCVTFAKDLNGACTNCVVKDQSTSCGLHHDNRMGYLQTRKNAAEAERSSLCSNTPVVENSSTTSVEEEQLGSRSSVEPLDVRDESTPPSSTCGSGDDRNSAPSGTNSGPSRSSRGKRRRSSATDEPSDDQRYESLDSRMKRDPFSPLRAHPSDYHGACILNRRKTNRCIDPVVGSLPGYVEPDSVHPPDVVFSDRRLEPGEAAPEEVQYIVSRLPCRYASFLHDGWQKDQSRLEEKVIQYESKWQFLSCVYWETLNELIERFCPIASKEPVHIDLTLD